MSLLKIKCKEDEILRLIIDFERTKYHISREQTIMERIGGSTTTFVDYFIDNY